MRGDSIVPILWMQISSSVNLPKGNHKIWTKVWSSLEGLHCRWWGLILEPASSRFWKNGGQKMRVPHFWVQLRSCISLPTAFEAELNHLNLTLVWLWKCSCLLIQISSSPSGELTCFPSPPLPVYGLAGYLIASWPQNQCIRKENEGKLSSTLVTWGSSWNQCPQGGFVFPMNLNVPVTHATKCAEVVIKENATIVPAGKCIRK